MHAQRAIREGLPGGKPREQARKQAESKPGEHAQSTPHEAWPVRAIQGRDVPALNPTVACRSINVHLEHHTPPQRHRRYGGSLLVAIIVSGGMMLVEGYYAWKTGSLALWSDAGHMLADLAGLLLAFLALRLASRPATPTASYGFQRYEVLAAAVNGLLLLGLAVTLMWRGFSRLQSPLDDLDTKVVFLIAALGLAANIVAALLLAKDAKENINARGALLNVLGDAAASVGVLGGIAIAHVTGDTRWDTYVSFLVAGFILVGAWKLLRQTGAILLEATPPGIDLAKVKQAVEGLQGVVNVHDLHCWAITPGQTSLTMHASIGTAHVSQFHAITKAIEELLDDRWGLQHCTIQLEPEGDPESDGFDPVG